jgi:hypothetical protein
MDDIKDIRPPVEVPWLVWLLVILTIVVIAAAAFVFFSRRKKKTDDPLPWDKALLRLTALSTKDYPSQNQFKLFYSELSDIVRRYLEERFNINAPEMTTEEFLNHCHTTQELTEDHKKLLRDFLNGCDLVKFAKHEPTKTEAQTNFDLAKKLVLDTKPLEINNGV